jgi:hypothetical protein
MSRSLRQAIAATAFAVKVSTTALARPSVAATFTLGDATITNLIEAFAQGLLTSQKLVQLYLDRIAAYDLPSGLN